MVEFKKHRSGIFCMGAAILRPPTDIPGTGRFSVIQAPQGAVFGILKMDSMEEQLDYEFFRVVLILT